MPDKKLTDNEIIKYFNSLYIKLLDVKYDLKITKKEFLALNEVHNLITLHQAEIENLKVENQSLRTAANSLKMHYEEVQSEIIKLNAENMLTMSERNAFRNSFYELSKQLKTAKSEAVKTFAERLKCGVSITSGVITCNDIDNLVKEMVGENNG